MRPAIRLSTFSRSTLAAVGLTFLLGACGAELPADEADHSAAAAVQPGSPEEAAILAVVNDPSVDVVVLDDDAGLDSRAANNIIDWRNGPDGVVLSGDDDLFDDIAELDAIKYVGNSALDKLLAYAKANGYYSTGNPAPTAAELDWAMLAMASDSAVDLTTLDDVVGLDSRAANNIIDWRNGDDGTPNTVDDRTFMTVQLLDDLGYVGNSALEKMRAYALDQGYLNQLPSGTRDVIFSPQPYHQSHAARIEQVLDSAQTSLDVAMYSFSDNTLYDAVERAAGRGVKIRFLFETTYDDRSKTGAALDNSRSARLENMGVDVRWVNKIMHHKFVLVDGPRDDAATAASTQIVTGSGNWSYSAATKYDENTLFLDNQPELALRMQREFNHMWDHSRAFDYNPNLVYELSTLSLDPATIIDNPEVHAWFTSDNFNVNGTTFSINSGTDTVSPQLVDAIQNATDSIWIASGHMRSRPVAEALKAKRQADPNIDIRIYLDGQEYISSWYNNVQLQKRADCIVAAGTSQSKINKCYDKGFLYGYELGQSGLDVRYKYYSYRWHYSYAKQMHHKLMIVDGDELWTGSYNLSDNAEHNTFENMVMLRGLRYADLIAQYRANFESLWDTERDTTTYDDLLDEVNTSQTIPLVFAPMSLTWTEVQWLKQAIYTNCTQVNTDPFRDDPQSHQLCPRL